MQDLLQWSSTQGHILTGDGRLEQLYTDFKPEELPHYHRCRGDTWEVFERWQSSPATRSTAALVAGAWRRPLFVGGWRHSDAHTETVVNMQTPSAFIDMRVPCGAAEQLPRGARGLSDLSLQQLRLFARRHAFAGVTRVERDATGAPVATRHHAIDWNFVGRMRPRPNKWRIEVHAGGDVWKEWGHARDEHGQHVYMERWERLEGGRGPCLALRRRSSGGSSSGGGKGTPDAFLLVCGDHFAYIQDRVVPLAGSGSVDVSGCSSLVEVVDAAVAAGDRATAEAYLSLQACHGRWRAGEPWVVDYALQPWLIGTTLLRPGEVVMAPSGKECMWGGAAWAVLECTLSPREMAALLGGPAASRL